MHPNSLKNLALGGRTPLHGENKKQHKVSLTPTAWAGVQAIAKQWGLSVSELMEQIGRGNVRLAAEEETPE